MARDESHPGICIVYSGEPFTAEEQAALEDEKAAEERWEKGVPINEIESKRGRPPKRPARAP